MLTVLQRGPDYVSPKGRVCRKWICQCECGNKTNSREDDLISGKSNNCGCVRKKKMSEYCKQRNATKEAKYRVGDSSLLGRVWHNMIYRCYHEKHQSYKWYGGRGIGVCDEWINDYQSFKKWAYLNGYVDGLSLDRIDVNGNYCPQNCRWVQRKEQASNTSRNRLITYNGQTKTLTQWSEQTGIGYSCLQTRLDKNVPVALAFTLPPSKHNPHISKWPQVYKEYYKN